MTPLFVVATIIIFLTADWAVQRYRARQAQVPQKAPGVYPFRTPDGVYFAKSHTWINLFPSGKLRLGVDDFVGSVLDNPEIELMRGVGEAVSKGDPLLVFSQGERRLVIPSPLDGTIVGINKDLEKNPKLMRDLLFSSGWAYSIRPARFEELRTLMLGEETRAWMQAELRRLRDLITGAPVTGTLAPAALQDGGLPVAGVLKNLDAASWKRFQDEFLQVR